ncbi:TetR/AcrR family transcriptional regulator [uncultured Clostridium sp.]|jgi:AcrR family transcriptional regulator|uniref:TetR/AcrR family transcriptional regulator n=1 Tax=uncultured Clostridium sp. TaxID=59620 RepID=UPI002607EF1D|nr:TetR/AcrR family transcriptional regulator [uncultured Clostridium sp.]
MTATLTSRQLKAIDTKNKILSTAMTLLEEYDFSSITINMICKKADVSVGTFYYYFKSIDFIIIEAYKNFDLHIEALHTNEFFNSDPISNLKSVLDQQLKYTLTYDIKIISQFYKSQISIGNEYFTSIDRYLPFLMKSFIENAKENNLITSNLDTKDLISDLLCISRGCIYNSCLKNNTDMLVENGNKLINIYINSFEI